MTRRQLAVVAESTSATKPHHVDPDELRVTIDTVREDVKDIEGFYVVSFSSTRIDRLTAYLEAKLADVDALSHARLDLQSQTDVVLIQKWMQAQLFSLRNAKAQHKLLDALVEPFATSLTSLIEQRQRVARVEGQSTAQVITDATKAIAARRAKLTESASSSPSAKDRFNAYRAVGVLGELRTHLSEWFGFYNGYDPLLSWWVKVPYAELTAEMDKYIETVREKLVGLSTEDTDTIIGQPAGREALLSELDEGFIAYTPEELIRLAEKEYAWCESEAVKAASAMGHGKDWRAALEQVKNMYVPPGEQPYLVKELSSEAVEYIKKHDMITVPRIAEECWPTTMMSPAAQKVNPFFLGGERIIVSYPTDTMAHDDKLMSLRGNARPLSRSTVFHELVPGHHLQFHSLARYRPYRQLFMNPYWVEGWAFYWEMLLWDKGFVNTPENKIGMLFWRMHRCIRIIFSLKFHLGLLSPQECIDLLVDKVGHERATAEGEVRRSFNGDYPPLYQAGYMVGALQFYALRRELVEGDGWSEKVFHDTVMKQGIMPIEILRALLKQERLAPNHKASWKFYNF